MIILLTGATSGIGVETALALAEKGHTLYLLVRDAVRGEQLKQEIINQTKNKEIFIVKCDLADLRSVAIASEVVKSKLTEINVLINNAGGIFDKREESKDGYEMTFAVNHLGHFLLTMELLPLLKKGQARVINVSSEAHKAGKPNFNDIQFLKSYSPFKAYGMSKLYNIYFTKSLAEKYGRDGISAFALHPGLVNSNFGSELGGLGKIIMWFARPFMITAEEGAKTSVYLATAPDLDMLSGRYFRREKVANTSAVASDEDNRNRLWAISEKLVKTFLG